MIFSSYRFLLIFFPITLLGYHLLRRTGRPTPVKLWLTAASLVFYGVGQPDFLLGFCLSILLNYAILYALDRTKRLWLRRALLLAAILWNVGLLVYFKYANFLLQNLNLLLRTDLPLLSTILPIGISFFTFQILACTVSLYRGDCALPAPLDYAAFVTFFPQLIVGPVVREEELMPQLREGRFLRFSPRDLYRGVMLFSCGCAKKILLADTMIAYAQGFYGGSMAEAGAVEAWAAVFSYVFAYYFDFSGYIDMARGLGYFFGVELPINFDSPYRARDFADFWRRWNMTISRFFNDAVFSNLFRFGDRVPKLIFATLATFVVSGLWHGAGWHYIAWGLVNGALVCLANLRALRGRRPLPAGLAVFLTFFTGALVRVLFDSRGLTQALAVYRRLFSFAGFRPGALLAFVGGHAVLCVTLAVSAALCFCAPNSNRISEKTEFTARDAILSGVLLALSLFCMSRVSAFLYFNF